MYDVYSGWSRLFAAGISITETNKRLCETPAASKEVITARSAIIGAALHSPITANRAELGRMVPKKMEAFSRAGSVMVSAWREGQTAWMGHMQHLGAMATRGRPSSLAELAKLGSRTATLTLESMEAGSKLGSDSLAPLHRGAVSNARRLRRKAAPKI
jgi:hypothetical protein